jgi:hypothetical protein
MGSQIQDYQPHCFALRYKIVAGQMAKLNEKQFGDAWEQDGFTLIYE